VVLEEKPDLAKVLEQLASTIASWEVHMQQTSRIAFGPVIITLGFIGVGCHSDGLVYPSSSAQLARTWIGSAKGIMARRRQSWLYTPSQQALCDRASHEWEAARGRISSSRQISQGP